MHLIILWYRPQGDCVRTLDKVEKLFPTMTGGKETILLGDTNCDLTLRAPEQITEKNNKHICCRYELLCLKQLIEEPTRVTLSTSSIIYNFAITIPSSIIESGLHNIFMSDHYMVFVYEMLRVHLKSGICLEQGMNETDDINVLVTRWLILFSSIIEMHAPIKSIRVSQRYYPWVNIKLKKLMQRRSKLKKAAIKRKSPFLMSSHRHIRKK